MRRQRKLVVVDDPDKLPIVILNADRPAFSGRESVGALDFLCGQCESVLAETVREETVQNIAVKCYRCGALNKFEDRH